MKWYEITIEIMAVLEILIFISIINMKRRLVKLDNKIKIITKNVTRQNTQHTLMEILEEIDIDKLAEENSSGLV